MHFQLVGKSLFEYFRSGRLPTCIRPSQCKYCKKRGKFHRHSSYPRKKIFLASRWYKGRFFIQRFMCVSCGKVFSFLPDIMYKWQQASLKVQERTVFKVHPLRPGLCNAFCLRTLYRWKQRWRQRTDQYRAKALQVLLSRKADISLDVSTYETHDTLSYLYSLWREAPPEMPSLLTAISILHFDRSSRKDTPQNLSASILAAGQVR